MDDSISAFVAADAGRGAEVTPPAKSASAAITVKRRDRETLWLEPLGIIAVPFCADMSNVTTEATPPHTVVYGYGYSSIFEKLVITTILHSLATLLTSHPFVLRICYDGEMDTVLHRWLKIPYTLHVTEFLSPKRPKATFILLHGIGNSAKAWEALIPLLPKNVRVIGIDLLGFGQSPHPHWSPYDARTQARSVGATLLKMRLLQQPTIVGHSLGSLVAVEVAKRYPLIVKKLILCSPPFYRQTEEKRRLLQRDEILKDLYRRMKKYPLTLESLSPLIVKLKLASPALNINEGNVASYVAALESSIVNQTSMQDAAKLKLPITVLYGALDPVVIGSNIRSLAKKNSNIIAKKIATGHEVVGRYVRIVAKEISQIVS